MAEMGKIIDKIRKLRRLAESANEHEAERAAAAAAALAARYQIEEAELIAAGEEKDEPVEVLDVEPNARGGRKVFWKSAIVAGLCDTLGVKFFWQRSGDGFSMRAVGRRSDVQSVAYLAGLIQREVSRLADAEARKQGFAGPSYARRWKGSFRLGCSARIRERMEEETRARRAAQQSGEQTQALVVIDKRRGEVARIAATLNLRRGRGASVSSGSGYAAGYAAGNGVSWSNQARGGLGTGGARIGGAV